MIRSLMLLILFTVIASAADKLAIPPYVAVSALVGMIVLFFWGIYKAVRTQKLVYALALLPFVILLFGMFFI